METIKLEEWEKLCDLYHETMSELREGHVPEDLLDQHDKLLGTLQAEEGQFNAVEELEEKIEDLSHNLEGKEEDIEELQVYNKRLRNQIKDLEADIKKLTDAVELEKLKRVAKKQNDRIFQLSEENDRLIVETQKAEAEIADLREVLRGTCPDIE